MNTLAHPLIALSLVAPTDSVAPAAHGPDRSLSSLVQLGDYDGDGQEDVFLIGGIGEDRLLRGEGGGRFSDVTVGAGLAGLSGTRVAAWVDWNRDGALDLFVLGRGGSPRLFRGDGSSFADVTADVRLDDALGGVDAQWRDVDGDGWSDLLLLTTTGPVLYRSREAHEFGVAEGLAGGTPSWTGVPTVASGRTESVDGSMAAPATDAGASTSPPSGGSAPALGGGGSSSTVTAGGTTTAAASWLCSPTIEDLATASCLAASSDPVLGALYPLSIDFNLDANGRVGVGTTTPSGRLHVLQDPISGRAIVGENSQNGGNGVEGRSTAISGNGVFGRATFATGAAAVGVRGQTESDAGTGVLGEATSLTGSATGVAGLVHSPDGTAVTAVNTASSGAATAVRGEIHSDSIGAVAILGESLDAAGGFTVGVEGRATSPDGIGVRGVTTSDGGAGVGVEALATGAGVAVAGLSNTPTPIGILSDGVGVVGWDFASSGATVGVHGQAESTSGAGVVGGVSAGGPGQAVDIVGVLGQIADLGVGQSAAVRGENIGTQHSDDIGVEGISTPAPFYGIGGQFTGGYRGVRGSAVLAGFGSRYGGFFEARNGDGANYGVFTEASDPQHDGGAAALFAVAGLDDGYAGDFFGKVRISGTIEKGGGSFKIDHPLDPENRYLYHSFVESPDMMNVYNGNVVLDAHGQARVELPEWFEALNRDFRYQLTSLGSFAPVYVAEEIRENAFRIAGGSPGGKVSWQVTGIRHDPFAEAHRIPVEEWKRPRERGHYLHPEAAGVPAERGIHATRMQEDEAKLREHEEAQEMRRSRSPGRSVSMTSAGVATVD